MLDRHLLSGLNERQESDPESIERGEPLKEGGESSHAQEEKELQERV